MDTARQDPYEMLLTPEQRRVLRSDLAEMRRRRLAAVDAAAYWPAPFDRIQAPDSRPWPDIDGEVVDPTP